MNELEETYNVARSYMEKEHEDLGDIKMLSKYKLNNLLNLYGYFRTIQDGNNTESQPSRQNFKDYICWYAWKKINNTNLTKEECMEKYIEIVNSFLNK